MKEKNLKQLQDDILAEYKQRFATTYTQNQGKFLVDAMTETAAVTWIQAITAIQKSAEDKSGKIAMDYFANTPIDNGNPNDIQTETEKPEHDVNQA